MNPANTSILEVHNWRTGTVQRQEGNSYSWITITPKSGTRITLHPPQHGDATNTLIELTIACLDALDGEDMPPTTAEILAEVLSRKAKKVAALADSPTPLGPTPIR